MQIFLKTLSGETVALEIGPSDTVEKIQEKMKDMEAGIALKLRGGMQILVETQDIIVETQVRKIFALVSIPSYRGETSILKPSYFQQIYKKKLSQTPIFRPFLPIFTYKNSIFGNTTLEKLKFWN